MFYALVYLYFYSNVCKSKRFPLLLQNEKRSKTQSPLNQHMKRIYNFLFALLMPLCLFAAKEQAPLVQPQYWWAGMHNPTLQVLIHGQGVGQCDVSITSAAVDVDSIVRPQNSNYLLLYLNTARAKAEKFDIVLKKGRSTQRIPYELREREARKVNSFSQADVIYLLMPDRFANGDTRNDVVKGLLEHTSSQAPFARHGGDLAGMCQHLDYLQQLGVTAVWPTPLLINDMPEQSYHGYAITDYYRIDPRYGTNEDYRDFVTEAHERGLKVVQDMVFNHCGSRNFLFTDLPDSTWFNNRSEYMQTSYKIAAVTDAHASDEDAVNATDGWFTQAMPDLNQRNPHVLRYLIQNSLFWIEYAGIDGIRQDTYPYADRRAMAQWCKEVEAEYPGFNIVGETWINNNVGVSSWQRHSPVVKQVDDDSQLPTVMDFPLMYRIAQAVDETTNEWDRGLAVVYDYLSQDVVYADPTHLLTFLDNHDTPRFAATREQAYRPARYCQALTLLLTLRGIPQVYYGDELAMWADKSKGDGELRQNFPGGFAGDSINAFTGKNLTPLMQHTLSLARRLLNWRKTSLAVQQGTFRHFTIKDGVYVYTRSYQGHTVTVMLNGTDAPATVDLARYAEALPRSQAKEVISGRTIQLNTGCLQLDVRGTLVLDFE